MSSKAQLLLASVRIPSSSNVNSLMASTNQVLLSMNTQMQQISSAFTLTKPTVTTDGTTGGITVGNITMGSTNFIRGGATGYNVGTGFWLGYDTNSPAGYKFFVGSASGNKMTWNGSTLAITGTITATSGTIGGWLIGPTNLSATAGGNTTTLSSGSTSFSSGPTGLPTVTITQAGILTCAGAVISGSSVDGTSTIGGRTASVLAGAINSAGNLINDVVNAKLSTASKQILDGFTFGASGALQIGTYSAGVSGDIKISPNGIVGRNKSNVTTFSIDGTTGAATFLGSITSTSGTIGGWSLAPTTLSAGGLYLDSTQNSIRSGQTDYETGTGYWLGNTSGTAKLSIGSTTNYFKWDGSNLVVQGGSGNNLVIIDTNGFTVGKAADRRVVMGTYGGNPASLNFFATTNPTTSRLGVYLNGGTAPSIDLAFPSGASFGVNANSTDFAMSGDTASSVHGSFTFNSVFGTPVFNLTGPNGTTVGANGPVFSISNTTDKVTAILRGGLVKLEANDGAGNTGSAQLGVDATGGVFFGTSATYGGSTTTFGLTNILGYGIVTLNSPSDPRFEITNDSTTYYCRLKATSLQLYDANLYRSAADTLKTDDSLIVSGTLTFGTYTGTALTIVGYVEIKDTGGTTRKLAVVA